MVLLIPLVCVTLATRLVSRLLARRGLRHAAPWDSWAAAVCAGMAVVFLSGAVTHFTEPQRSGFAAIVPPLGIDPLLIVTLSGIAEIVLAIGLLTPRLRAWACIASLIFLVAVFPANIIAASGVDNVAAPHTPLLPRTLLQLAFITAVAFPLVAGIRQRAARDGDRQPVGHGK